MSQPLALRSAGQHRRDTAGCHRLDARVDVAGDEQQVPVVVPQVELVNRFLVGDTVPERVEGIDGYVHVNPALRDKVRECLAQRLRPQGRLVPGIQDEPPEAEHQLGGHPAR